MKREFLQNIKVGDQALPKEVIDMILDEHSRGIGAEKAKYADYDTIKTQLGEAQKTIKGLQDQDIEGARKSAKEWEEKYNQAIADHQKQMADMAFDQSLDTAIAGIKGKNAKAIKALLDMEALKKSTNQDADIKAALEALKKDSGYLFEEAAKAPPYAPGAGAGGVGGAVDGVAAAFSALNPGLKI
jgi:hypothetical protein